ncbi:metallophosphoesterase [Candidatus Pacearchaeota archaeon]|nr:metallophosphoesterase [Candidatus Pacearchaeota archaeon]
MKILVLGDFHGTFLGKFKNIIKKEKIDLLISNGDYFPFHYRKLWFKYCYESLQPLWKFIGKKKYKKIILKDLKDGERALKEINNLPIPVMSVHGNIDYTREDDSRDFKYDKNQHWKWDEQDFFSKIIKKYRNIMRFDYSYFKFMDIVFIGAYGSSFPGRVKSKAFRKSRKILDRLFKRFAEENKERRVIFVSHNVPFNSKLDLITSKKAHKEAKERHYGSKLIRRIIDKYQPLLHFGGHIHESSGMQKLGKTICINSGSAHEGKGAIVEIPDNGKGKVGVKFIK